MFLESMLSPICNFFGQILNFLYGIVGNNFGMAIILFTIITKLIIIPITINQQKTMQKTNKIQGRLKDLQVKYKNNQEMLSKATMDLYKSENISPLSGCSGCLTGIIQILLVFSVFFVVSKPLTYMKNVPKDVIDNYKNEIQLENPDGKVSNYYEIQIVQKKSSENPDVHINMDFIGLDLSKVPKDNLSDFKVYIIPILYVISSFISIKMTTKMQEELKNNKGSKDLIDPSKKSEMDAMEQMSKNMMYIIPITTVSIAFIAPLGLALYWFVSNILAVGERIIIKKFVSAKEDNKNA
ncbi:MAG: YidC/Oxa1 family membrane protein insertase [Clostridiales bacterium]|nr:YidC/Oxa1 family membrane protein insertase [Clostridiales bacterium]